MRQLFDRPDYHAMCACGVFNAFCKIADGVDEVLRATREELRQGAHCIKIMGSGGVASPTDPIWMNQYREDEIRAIVGECTERRTYAAAHCHPASAVRRCAEFGVRSIEHGTLIIDETARFIAASAPTRPHDGDLLRARRGGADWDSRPTARRRPSTPTSRPSRAWTRCAPRA